MSSTGEYKEDDHLFQWFRSRKMEYVRIFIENASLHEFMDKIGNIAAMQITDVFRFLIPLFLILQIVELEPNCD